MTVQLESPRNERDILTDGFITQAGVDAAQKAVSKVEFNPSPTGYEAVFYSGTNVQVFPTTTVASINSSNTWTWRNPPAFPFLPQSGVNASGATNALRRFRGTITPMCNTLARRKRANLH